MDVRSTRFMEGYLIDQFAISLFNHRQDEYGGSLENRLRFAREIVEEIKKRCGNDFPVTLRYSPKSFIKGLRDGALPGEEFEEKGRDLEEGIEAAKLLVSYGYDALDVDVGSYDSWWWSHPPMYQSKGLYRPYAKLMKETVNVPIICARRMDNPDMALEAIENNETDMISLGRPLLADPDYVNKLRYNDLLSIRPCISCHEGCMGRIQEYSILNCAVNPQACREKDMAYRPILKPKKVMIVGGGVAGCETALYLSKKGKKVTIVEALDKLLAVNGPLCHANSEMLERLIPFNNIDVITNAQAVELKNDSLMLKNGQTVKADSVVLAVGYKEENSLYNELQFEIPEIYVLGDAKNVANIMYGIWDAFEVANNID